MTDFPHGKHPNSLKNLQPKPPEYGKKKVIKNLTLSPQLVAALEGEAKNRGLSVSKTVEELLREHTDVTRWLE